MYTGQTKQQTHSGGKQTKSCTTKVETKMELASTHTEKRWWQHCHTSTTGDSTRSQRKKTREHLVMRPKERHVDSQVSSTAGEKWTRQHRTKLDVVKKLELYVCSKLFYDATQLKHNNNHGHNNDQKTKLHEYGLCGNENKFQIAPTKWHTTILICFIMTCPIVHLQLCYNRSAVKIQWLTWNDAIIYRRPQLAAK